MIFFSKCKTVNVHIESISINNDDFKISKPPGDDRLKQSIQSSGLLDLPILYKENNLYKILIGHNRLAVLKELNFTDVVCYLIDVPESGLFIEQALLKNFRREIGPIGKSKFIWILRNRFSMNESDIIHAAKNIQLPEDFYYFNQIEKILSLPEPLKKYLDIKDIGFKIIKNILRLSDDICVLLSNWVINTGIRVNIFKGIIDLVTDITKINKTDSTFSELNRIDITSVDPIESTLRKDEMLYMEIFKIRYPEYTEIKLKADKIICDLSKNGLEIDFPEFFERDEIGILLKINKRNNIEGFNKILNQINTEGLKKLLDLL
jgi:hypothetical protein